MDYVGRFIKKRDEMFMERLRVFLECIGISANSDDECIEQYKKYRKGLMKKPNKVNETFVNNVSMFVDNNPKLNDPEYAYGRCDYLSKKFVEEFGGEAIFLVGCVKPYKNVHDYLTDYCNDDGLLDSFCHCVVKVGDWIFDPSIRQLDKKADVKHVYSIVDLYKQWLFVTDEDTCDSIL